MESKHAGSIPEEFRFLFEDIDDFQSKPSLATTTANRLALLYGGDTVQTQGGSALTATGNTTVNITGVNDAPVLDLDADDSAAGGADFSTTWTEGSGPALIADVDAFLTDVDSAN